MTKQILLNPLKQLKKLSFNDNTSYGVAINFHVDLGCLSAYNDTST